MEPFSLDSLEKAIKEEIEQEFSEKRCAYDKEIGYNAVREKFVELTQQWKELIGPLPDEIQFTDLDEVRNFVFRPIFYRLMLIVFLSRCLYTNV